MKKYTPGFIFAFLLISFLGYFVSKNKPLSPVEVFDKQLNDCLAGKEIKSEETRLFFECGKVYLSNEFFVELSDTNKRILELKKCYAESKGWNESYLRTYDKGETYILTIYHIAPIPQPTVTPTPDLEIREFEEATKNLKCE